MYAAYLYLLRAVDAAGTARRPVSRREEMSPEGAGRDIPPDPLSRPGACPEKLSPRLSSVPARPG